MSHTHALARGATLCCLAAVAVACHSAPPSAAPVPDPSAGAETRPAASAGRSGRVISGRDVRNVNAARVEQLMEGRFAGVEVMRLPGGGITVRIRGGSSLLGDNEPLYVIDGMEVQPAPGGALNGINPGDVARIEVLKDVGSTSRYGVRGANGVVLITTRHD